MSLSVSFRTARTVAFAAIVAVLLFAGGRTGRAMAWSAGGPLLPNGSAQGSGFATTITDQSSYVQLSLRGARAGATYAVFSCIGLFGGDFNCTNKNLPSTVQQVVVAPKGIAPVVVTLVQQGTLQVDGNGGGSAVIGLTQGVYPDQVHSIYNVVQLVNTSDGNDSYTALDLQAPGRAALGVSALYGPVVTLALGVPVFVFAQFPGYAFPVSFTSIAGLPFYPFFNVPFGFFGQPSPFFIGTCPNGLPPQAHPSPFGGIYFTC